MNELEKIAACIRLANEYKVLDATKLTALRDESIVQAKLKWADAVPKGLPNSPYGWLLRAVVLPLGIIVVATLRFIVGPIYAIVERQRAGSQAVGAGNKLSEQRIASSVLQSEATTLIQLWREHGLHDRSGLNEYGARIECLVRWVDILYGKGVAISSRLEPRASAKKRASSEVLANAQHMGMRLSIKDDIDSLVAELSTELPAIRTNATSPQDPLMKDSI